MDKKTKYCRPLAPLLKQSAFTAAEARSRKIPTRMLDYYCKQGLIERLDRGVYRGFDEDLHIDVHLEELVYTAATIPHGVICLISALSYYQLTDQIMRQYWVAIPNEEYPPKRKHLRAVRMRNTKLGQIMVKIGKVKMKIFDRERTIVDAFRYLSHEVAIKALRAYFTKCKPNLQKLAEYAKILRVDLNPYILAYTT